ncbi:hypothetical protein DFH07DRAFT_939360 [Mycena maculata]|uniref:Fe2OG dioxygenase domain-containing protein n=1 Tax=Mycena maculata TaxID=230809 RepID=A0AAD7JFF7_9AGAR|nr:hypothetical protein DFH07DRAFT_939360 [Mycena maculata]
MDFVPLPDSVPVAELQTVESCGLRDGDQGEVVKLLAACRTDGFFYLDIRGMVELAPMVDDMYRLERKLFDLPVDEKMKYDIDINTNDLSRMKLNGYKPLGRNFGGIQGGRDGFETYAIPNNGVAGLQDVDFRRPAVVDEYMPTLRQLSGAVAEAARLIYTSLSRTLRLSPGRGFEDMHRASEPKPDLIRLLKYHAQPVEERGALNTPHTDLGSLTFLFASQPGLQVLQDNKNDEWRWVQPRPGHVVVNLGDGMAVLSNGYLCSCLHRVAPLPGRAMPERYSFAYLMRAEDATVMTGLDSTLFPPYPAEGRELYTSGEWIQRKFGMLRGNDKKPGQDAVLTGRTGLVV